VDPWIGAGPMGATGACQTLKQCRNLLTEALIGGEVDGSFVAATDQSTFAQSGFSNDQTSPHMRCPPSIARTSPVMNLPDGAAR
jgi:hypothetical protein